MDLTEFRNSGVRKGDKVITHPREVVEVQPDGVAAEVLTTLMETT